MTTCAAAGCGSIIGITADAGTGAGGTGGTGAAGGAGATDGGNQGGANGATCPTGEPNDGATCPRNGLVCEYGTDPRGDSCRGKATCTSAHWAVSVPDPSACPSIGVTTCSGKADSTCSTDGTYCTQSNGVDCECTSCPSTAPVCVAGTPPTLSCKTSTMSGCPAAEPNLGTSCGMEGLICSYCPDISRVCTNGLWTAGNACPVVN